MTRLLVLWEDERFEPLSLFVKKRLSARKPADQGEFPQVLFHTSRGNGRFEPYVRDVWPRVRGVGLPANPGAIDHLVCVVDGDKLHGLLHGKVSPPPQAPQVAAWHLAAMAAWRTHVSGAASSSGLTATVHGHVLRWNKESLALAGYDCLPAREHLELDANSPALQRFLAACNPSPGSVEAAAFSDSFAKPLRCLEDARKAVGLLGGLKNAPEVDDMLRALAQAHVEAVCNRVPDIDKIVDLIWSLCAPGGPSPEAPAAAPAQPPGAERKAKNKSGAKPPGRAPRGSSNKKP